MNIEQLLTDAVVKAIKACYGADITPRTGANSENAPRLRGTPHRGHFPLLAHLQAKARRHRRRPRIVVWSKNTDLVSTFNIVKGFLNLTIAPKKWIELLENIDADQRYGLATPR